MTKEKNCTFQKTGKAHLRNWSGKVEPKQPGLKHRLKPSNRGYWEVPLPQMDKVWGVTEHRLKECIVFSKPNLYKE